MRGLILDSLIKQKNKENRKPLILKGVRQCGKTYILKEFGMKCYKNFVYCNFEENKSFSKIFEEDFDVKRIVFELSLLTGVSIEKGNTLIFLDEIQESSRAITSLKHFCENGSEYHVVSAGSLLGIAIHEDTSFPVGKVEFLNLYPMSFFEFLLASDHEMLFNYLNDFKEDKVPEVVSRKIENLLREYFAVGGMPEVVSSWIKNRSLQDIDDIQENILNSYALDFIKHAKAKEFPKLTAIWRSIPNQLAKASSKFIFSHVKEGYRARDLEDALERLIDAGLIFKVSKIEKPYIPLSSYSDNSYFKIYLSDVGLLRKLSEVDSEVIFQSADLFTEFKGAMTENFVLNELIKSNIGVPYYWVSQNSAEVDFVIQIGKYISPIEVKASKNVKAKSLGIYIDKYHPKFAFKTSLKENFGGDKIFQIPLYLISNISKYLKYKIRCHQNDDYIVFF